MMPNRNSSIGAMQARAAPVGDRSSSWSWSWPGSLGRWLAAVLGPGPLAACTMPGQVGLPRHLNFAPPPASDPVPLLQDPGNLKVIGARIAPEGWGSIALAVPR